MLDTRQLGQEPIRIVVNGQPRWLFADGTSLLAIAGGDGTTDGGTGQGAGGEGGGSANQPAAGSGGQGGDDEPFDKDRAIATIKKLREVEKASKSQTKELEELRTKVKAAEDAQLSDAERLQKEAKEHKERADRLETQLREQRVASAVITASVKLNVVDPDVAQRLLDPTKLQFDDSGAPTNVEALLKDLLEAKPYLKGNGTNGGAATGAARGTPSSPKPAGSQSQAEATKSAREALVGNPRYGQL